MSYLFPGYSSMTGNSSAEAIYVSKKRQILGSKLRVLCLLGIDAMLDSNGYVLSCPDRISGGTLTRIRGGMQTVTVSNSLGKKTISHIGAETEDAALGMITTWAPKSMLAVASTLDSVATTYNILVRGNPYLNDSAWLCRDNGTSNIANVWGTKYINGSAGVAISTGIRCYESEKSDNTDTGVVVMGYQHTTGGSWRGNLFELRITDAVLTVGERAAESSLTNAFWGIV